MSAICKEAWVVAEVESGVRNEAEPEVGAIVRLEIVSELSTRKPTPPGATSSSVTKDDRKTR
jgi:hypothetical protein